MKTVLASLLLAVASQPTDDPITLGELETLKPQQAASRLLPPEIAAKIVGGMVRRQFWQGQVYWVGLWERAEPIGAAVCTRRVHSFRLGDPTAASAPAKSLAMPLLETVKYQSYGISYPTAGSADSCAKVEGFASVQPQLADATIAALDQFAAAMRAAASKGPLPFKLECRAEEGLDACSNPRAALATLPLEALGAVHFESGRYQVLSETPTASGTSVRVQQMMPAADGGPGTPIITLAMSPPDGRSWRIELETIGGRLERVAMNRTMIIYH